MPKAGLEPARLAAPPPQDGVSANSTTSAFKAGTGCRHSDLLLLWRGRRRSRSRRALLLLLGRRLLLLLVLLLIFLFRAFAHDGGAARLRDQDRERQRCDHEKDCRGCGRFAQDRSGAAGAERGLGAAAAEGSGPISAFTLLQEHDQNKQH